MQTQNEKKELICTFDNCTELQGENEYCSELHQKMDSAGLVMDQEEAVKAYIELGIGDDDLSDFEEAYQGQYTSDEEFAQDLAEQLGSINPNMAWPYNCIDWERASNELMYDYSEQDGFYFRNI